MANSYYGGRIVSTYDLYNVCVGVS
jgi:hypothetical protein